MTLLPSAAYSASIGKPISVSSQRRTTMTREETMNIHDEQRQRRPGDGDVRTQGAPSAKKVCIVGASGKLGQYMVQHALSRGYEVVGVCREESVGKLGAFKGRITIVAGATDDREVIKRAVAGCDAALVVLVPRGVHGYSSGTAQAVLDYAEPGARLVFSCGWHITRDGKDVYPFKIKAIVKILGPLARLARFAHVGDPILESNRTRRIDFALFMVEALENDELVHEAPAIVGRQTPSALTHSGRDPAAKELPGR